MTLAELVEPLFQYICRVNRAGRKGAQMPYARLRREVDDLFATMREQSQPDPHLAAQYRQVDRPLVFFVDSMISESEHEAGAEWDRKRIAYEEKELAGDQKFYDLLDIAMEDRGDAATERIQIFYTCIGLGFVGYFHRKQPELLRQKMLELSHRLRGVLEANPTARITPEAYEHPDTRDLIQPPAGRLWFMALLFLIFVVTAVACNFYVFWKISNQLTYSLAEILRQSQWLGL